MRNDAGEGAGKGAGKGADVAQYGPAFLALGDSYTIGEQVAAAARWPAQLVRALRAAGVPVGEPQIIAKTGWTTDELAAGIETAGLTGSYALVSLLIGVNNQYRGRSADEYREQFRGPLDDAIAFAGGKVARVMVLSIPDWGVMPFAEGRDRAKIGREIDQFNAVTKDESARAGAAWWISRPYHVRCRIVGPHRTGCTPQACNTLRGPRWRSSPPSERWR